MTEENQDEFEKSVEDTEEAEAAAQAQAQEEQTGEAEAAIEPEKKVASFEELQAEVEDLRKESDGRLKALRAERQERQDLKTKIDTITNMIGQIKAARQEGDAGAVKEPEKTIEGIPVSFNEEGDAFVDPEALQAVTADLKKQVTQLQETLKASQTAQGQQATAQSDLNAVLSKNPAYRDSYTTIGQAYGFISKSLEDLVLKQDIDPKSFTGIEDVLDLLEDSKSFMAEFAKRYPGLSPDLVVEAFLPTRSGHVNKRKLTQALDALKASSASNQEEEKGLSKTLKFLTKKPSNLASASNQRGAAESTLDDIAGMNIDDFLGMTDQQVAELERTLYDEEMRGA